MPHNTTVHDLLFLINRLNCIHKARRAEFELSHYRKYGKLPEHGEFIKEVHQINGEELIELKEKGA